MKTVNEIVMVFVTFEYIKAREDKFIFLLNKFI